MAVELTGDPRFAQRVRRLAITSLVALGIIWALATRTLATPFIVSVALAAGWALMPSILLLSLGQPAWRYALVLPSALVGCALLVICTTLLPEPTGARLGWLLLTGGIWLGAALGAWFWFRWLPVPQRLQDPFSRGRWLVIALHVGLVATGSTLVWISAR